MRIFTRNSTAAGVLLSASMATSCFTADLDPDIGGAFACEADDDCPDGGACINQRCEVEPAPVVAILSPEPQQVFAHSSDGSTTSVRFIVSASNLSLVDPATTTEHVFGEGHVRVTLDGKELTTITSGAISGGIEQTISVDNTPGGHRIQAMVLRNDRRPYDHAKGRVNRLFWLDDGAPHVAITTPWPNTEFPLDSTGPVQVEIEALNFTVVEPSNVPKMELQGHAHVHYDVALRGCFETTPVGCDAGYRQLIGARSDACSTSSQGSCAVLIDGFPSSGETQTRLSVTLRHSDHDPYYHPFLGAELDEDQQALVLDEIMISRVRNPSL